MTRPGHRRPKEYKSTDFPSFAVTVDAVVLTLVDGSLQVLLIRRRDLPYAGYWALPGGFKRVDESLDEAVERELREETMVNTVSLSQIGTYGDPGRDPRQNIVTVVYLAITPEVGEVAGGTDAAEAKLWPVSQALDDLDLAFDHARILEDAVAWVADELEKRDLALAFVRPAFTLPELQAVYEAVWGTALDRANFQRALRASSRPSADEPPVRFIEPTGELGTPTGKGGPRPELYRAGQAWSSGSPIRAPRAATADWSNIGSATRRQTSQNIGPR